MIKPTSSTIPNKHKKDVTFEIVKPDGMTVEYVLSPSGTAGNATIWAQGTFYYQVTPTTVNFENLGFYEDVDKTSWTWPDGTKDDNGGPSGSNSSVFLVTRSSDGVKMWNMIEDDVNSGSRDIAKIKKNGAIQAFTIGTAADPLRTHTSWVDDTPAKHEIKVLDMKWEWDANGKGRATSGGKSADWIGPFN